MLEGGQIDDGLLGGSALLSEEFAADGLLQFEDRSHVFEVAESLREGHESVLLREDSAPEGGRDVLEDTRTGTILPEVEDGLDLLQVQGRLH